MNPRCKAQHKRYKRYLLVKPPAFAIQGQGGRRSKLKSPIHKCMFSSLQCLPLKCKAHKWKPIDSSLNLLLSLLRGGGLCGFFGLLRLLGGLSLCFLPGLPGIILNFLLFAALYRVFKALLLCLDIGFLALRIELFLHYLLLLRGLVFRDCFLPRSIAFSKPCCCASTSAFLRSASNCSFIIFCCSGVWSFGIALAPVFSQFHMQGS